ncbi:MAG: MBL fold metallo-hydrolase [Leptospiraceae bacterium]|nr:MBL fold metallo-hydrolase [Leptospiraceae bacterium]MCP5499896.1 MBL fold metallo-hydrolase [Leptospiraceae bacterium]
MKKFHYLYTGKEHSWGVIAKDPERQNHLIDTNEYVLSNHSELLICDPGGIEIYPSVFSSLSTEFDPQKISYIFSSHQDPDVISSLSLWLDLNPNLRCITSKVWSSFIPHFGGTKETFISIEDKGEIFNFGEIELQLVPAHYLHSSGNFNLYDPIAGIFYSGDIGASLLPESELGESLFVENFDNHIRFAKAFHERWMTSNEAKIKWCERVSKLKIDLLCPQHGLIYSGQDVERFINWFAELRVGIAVDSI